MVSEQHQLNLIETIEELVQAGDLAAARALLVNRHPADQADLLEELEDDSIRQLIGTLEPAEVAEILEYLEDDYRRQVVQGVEPAELLPILDEVDEDLAADIVQDLPAEQAEQLVPLLEYQEAVEEILGYPEESAGGRMSADFVALRRNWTVDEALIFLRQEQPDPHQPFYLHVVDDEGVLLGVVGLRSLITADPGTPIESIMTTDAISVNALDDQEVAAERMRHYNLLALPVIDADGRLRGVITADDVLDVQVEEATEDMNLMAGLSEEERLFRPIRYALPPRLAWLSVNLLTAFLGAVTVSMFEGTIEKVAALAIFMPVIAGMGGNSGIQTITLVVRSIALGEIGAGDALYALRHEVTIAVIKGVVLGVTVAVVAWLWQDSAWLGLVVGAAMLTNIVVAAAVGVLVPLGLKLVRADPALAAGVIVTTFSDVIGFLTFLGLATILVSKLS